MLIALVVGMVMASSFGLVDFGHVGMAPWFDVVRPFAFGAPTYESASIVTLCIVMIVVMIESAGMFRVLAEICADPVDRKHLTGRLRGDGLGLSPKLAAMVEAVPRCVLSAVDLTHSRNNLFVVAVSVGFGTSPLVAPNSFRQMPHGLRPLLASGILPCRIAAVATNLFFDGLQTEERARAAARKQAPKCEH